MKQERFSVRERNSTQAELGGIIVSVVQTLGDRATIVVGHPGLPNIERMLHVGGALLFETSDGLFEVRVMSISGSEVAMLLTYVSPQPGIAGGFVDQDQSNSPFTPSELVEIAKSLQHIRLIMSERSDVAPEKLDFISRKLDEMQAASERFGKRTGRISLSELSRILFLLLLLIQQLQKLFLMQQVQPYRGFGAKA